MALLSKEPIYVELGGRKREVRFTLNEAILIRDMGFENKPLTQRIGESDEGAKYQANLDAVRIYAYATLMADAAAHQEEWTLDIAGSLIYNDDIWKLIDAMSRALLRFYGGEPKAEGGAKATPAAKKKAGR